MASAAIEERLVAQEIVDHIERKFGERDTKIFVAITRGDETARDVAARCGLTEARISQIRKKIVAFILKELK